MGQIAEVKPPVYAFLKCPVPPLGSKNLLVIMWPESFGGFTLDSGPFLQAILWSLILIIPIILKIPMAP